jgi:acetyltransferase-like isoleucine patch superfamily enzyme
MSKAAIRSTLAGLALLKARALFGNSIGPACKLSLSSDVRRSTLHGCNEIGARSVVHQSTLGRHSYLGDDCRIIKADIGMFSALGCGIKTAFGSHPSHYLAQHPATYSTVSGMPSFAGTQLYETEHVLTPEGGFVTIGHDVWIGDGVSIFDGVTIGHGAAIGANSLVTKSIPPYAIAWGSPAKVVRYRFSEEDIATLLRLQWWAWDEKDIHLSVNKGLFKGAANALDEFYSNRKARDATNRP